jgi:putative transposase
MVDRKDPLPVTRQCALLDLPRSTFYHVPKPISDEELELMALIDRCCAFRPRRTLVPVMADTIGA